MKRTEPENSGQRSQRKRIGHWEVHEGRKKSWYDEIRNNWIKSLGRQNTRFEGGFIVRGLSKPFRFKTHPTNRSKMQHVLCFPYCLKDQAHFPNCLKGADTAGNGLLYFLGS